jgi:ectoine hydroxylase-related dioxygenase (phytanoyl-CoA dioxygenase family)
MQSPSIAERYSEQGFHFPIDAIPPEMARDAARRVEALLAEPPKGLKHPWNLKAHLLFDWVYGLCVHPAVLDAVEAVIGPDILMQAADLFAKPAHGTKLINWHQDANYWGFDPYELCTAWIALSDVYPENGCMRFLPASHRQNKVRHNETFAADSDLTRGQEIAMAIDETRTVPVILKAGQISLHHCLLAHASGPNRTDSPRIGLAIRFIATSVRQTEGPPMSAILVRGEDRFGHFTADQPPAGSLDAAAIAAHDRAMAPHAPFKYATA